MWNDVKSQRFDVLRLQEAQRALTEVEKQELAELTADLDADEAKALQPALDRLAHEANELRSTKARVEAQAQELERVVAQQEKLLAEARSYAGRLRQQRAMLADEFRRLRAGEAHAR